MSHSPFFFFFFFNDTATTEIYTLSLHDALPISRCALPATVGDPSSHSEEAPAHARSCSRRPDRSEEHTSELQSLAYLVCRLLLEKKKKKQKKINKEKLVRNNSRACIKPSGCMSI